MQGWVCITGENANNKHDERFYFGARQVVDLTADVCNEFSRLVREYQDRHQDELSDEVRKKRTGKELALSHFMWERAEVSVGDLVYAKVNGQKVEYIIPVQLSRRKYSGSRGDLLPHYLHTCRKYEKLCPACRLFGWVQPAQPKESKKSPNLSEVVAYAGRVSFSMGRMIDDHGCEERVTLAELASPKPTATFFYLAGSDGLGRFIGKREGYNPENQRLRGRKFYRHHGCFKWRTSEPTRRNRTLIDPVSPKSRFQFEVRFTNLLSEELGALAWSLQLEEGMFHRLGYGKSLGLGSVKITLKECRIYDFVQRYSSLVENGEKEIDFFQFIDDFKKSFREINGKNFDNQDNIIDLKAILSKHPLELPVYYPQLDQGQNENFRWFKKAQESSLSLPLAHTDLGLPIRP